jgi:hypothetical protein
MGKMPHSMDNLTTRAKRLRPLLLRIAQGATQANEWDNIILIVADGGGATYYDPDNTGFAAAIAAASSGDVIYVPPASISGNHTIPAGVEIWGAGQQETIFTGTITNNGICNNFKINGNLVQNSGSRAVLIFVAVSSGTGITQSAAAEISHCRVQVGTGATYGIDISDGFLTNTFVGTDGGGSNIGVYSHGSTVDIFHCRFAGAAAGGLINESNYVNNCVFEGTVDGDGLRHTTSDAAVIGNSRCLTGGGTGYGINLSDTGLVLSDCNWDTIDGIENITYGEGDRGSYSVEDYHAADIEGAALLRHLPSPVGEDDNDIAFVDTNVWVIGSAADAGIGAGSDEKVGVSANDSTPGYLNGKLVAGDNITLTEDNDGGDETLTIDASGGAAASLDDYWEPAVVAEGDDIFYDANGDIAMVWVT